MWRIEVSAAVSVRRWFGLSPELLGSDDAVMLITEVTGVAVIVCATKGQRDDVIHYGGDGDDAFGLAELAHVVGAEHAAVTLLYPCPASEAWGLMLDGSSDLRLEGCHNGLDGLEAGHDIAFPLRLGEALVT